jgi:mRNA interferase MazF
MPVFGLGWRTGKPVRVISELRGVLEANRLEVRRQTLLDSRFSTAMCAPVYSSFDGLSTQVPVGVDEGLKHASSIHCDELISIFKSSLTSFIATLSSDKIAALNRALAIAVGIDTPA